MLLFSSDSSSRGHLGYSFNRLSERSNLKPGPRLGCTREQAPAPCCLASGRGNSQENKQPIRQKLVCNTKIQKLQNQRFFPRCHANSFSDKLALSMRETPRLHFFLPLGLWAEWHRVTTPNLTGVLCETWGTSQITFPKSETLLWVLKSIGLWGFGIRDP